ncbi:MAG: FliI/YscN family ATPase [Spirochaetia bacterium]|jgi:flagellum-specific ATP synthase|nr:FliI/YscN family ATPase [Spirochaetia bacterium]
MSTVFEKYQSLVANTDPIKFTGRVVKVQGLLIESHGPRAVLGELCYIIMSNSPVPVWAEVVSLRQETIQLMAFDSFEGIEIGNPVVASGRSLEVPVSPGMLGRVLDGMGRPCDDRGNIRSASRIPVFNSPPDLLKRKPINEQIQTGVRAIDSLLAVGKGQRIGIFSGAGVGKSTLLGMIARNTNADINVIALVGERGREVTEFIENELGPEGMKKSVIVVSSSNTPPISRIRGAYTATAIAEYFRERGKDVMLFFDSLTRFARAQREVGLAIGEPPATRGYTPSVFTEMPKLLERCANSSKGTLTGFYTVLVEGDDLDEPVADNAEGFLDGHIILSRKMAEANHYPAIDILKSISRIADKILPADIKASAGYIKNRMAVYNEAEDLINVGAYVKGSNPDIDESIKKLPAIKEFLNQPVEEKSTLEKSFTALTEISGIKG